MTKGAFLKLAKAKPLTTMLFFFRQRPNIEKQKQKQKIGEVYFLAHFKAKPITDFLA